MANRVAEALGKSKTTNHKDSLKIFINCHHCKCLREMDLGKNYCSKTSNQDEETLDGSESENSFVPALDEIVLFMEGLSIDNENEIVARTEGDSVTCNFSKSKEDTEDVETNNLHGLNHPSSATSVLGHVQKTEDQGSCSFSVKLKSSKSSQHGARQMCDKMALKEQLNLFAFFCLIRAR